jgi:hypothetical protein
MYLLTNYSSQHLYPCLFEKLVTHSKKCYLKIGEMKLHSGFCMNIDEVMLTTPLK